MDRDADAENSIARRADASRRPRVAVEPAVEISGKTASLVADGDFVHVTTAGRVSRRMQRIPLTEVSAVDAVARPEGVLVQIILEDGHRIAVMVPASQSEAAFQAATVLNLQAAEARRHRSVGRGLGVRGLERRPQASRGRIR